MQKMIIYIFYKEIQHVLVNLTCSLQVLYCTIGYYLGQYTGNVLGIEEIGERHQEKGEESGVLIYHHLLFKLFLLFCMIKLFIFGCKI